MEPSSQAARKIETPQTARPAEPGARDAGQAQGGQGPGAQKERRTAALPTADGPSISPISTEFFLHSLLLMLGRIGNGIINFYNRLFVLDNKDLRQIYDNLGRGFRKKGMPDKALVAYRELVRIAPNNPDAQYQMARICSAQGDLELAAQCYKNVLQQKPTHAEAWYHLGVVYSKTREVASSVEAMSKAVELAPQNHPWHYKLGVLLDKAGTPEKALQHLQKAIELRPDEPKYHQYLGFVFEGLGRHEEAVQHFKAVMELEGAREPEEA